MARKFRDRPFKPKLLKAKSNSPTTLAFEEPKTSTPKSTTPVPDRQVSKVTDPNVASLLLAMINPDVAAKLDGKTQVAEVNGPAPLPCAQGVPSQGAGSKPCPYQVRFGIPDRMKYYEVPLLKCTGQVTPQVSMRTPACLCPYCARNVGKTYKSLGELWESIEVHLYPFEIEVPQEYQRPDQQQFIIPSPHPEKPTFYGWRHDGMLIPFTACEEALKGNCCCADALRAGPILYCCTEFESCNHRSIDQRNRLHCGRFASNPTPEDKEKESRLVYSAVEPINPGHPSGDFKSLLNFRRELAISNGNRLPPVSPPLFPNNAGGLSPDPYGRSFVMPRVLPLTDKPVKIVELTGQAPLIIPDISPDLPVHRKYLPGFGPGWIPNFPAERKTSVPFQLAPKDRVLLRLQRDPPVSLRRSTTPGSIDSGCLPTHPVPWVPAEDEEVPQSARPISDNTRVPRPQRASLIAQFNIAFNNATKTAPKMAPLSAQSSVSTSASGSPNGSTPVRHRSIAFSTPSSSSFPSPTPSGKKLSRRERKLLRKREIQAAAAAKARTPQSTNTLATPPTRYPPRPTGTPTILNAPKPTGTPRLPIPPTARRNRTRTPAPNTLTTPLKQILHPREMEDDDTTDEPKDTKETKVNTNADSKPNPPASASKPAAPVVAPATTVQAPAPRRPTYAEMVKGKSKAVVAP